MTIEDRIWQIAQRHPNGFTRYIYGLNRPVSGFCVAYLDTQNCFGRPGLSRALRHAQTHAQIIGGWRSGGQYYFDSVRVYHTRRAAIESAIRERQIGYFNLNGGYVPVMDNNNQLLPRYRNMVIRWNRNRARLGRQPFMILEPSDVAEVQDNRAPSRSRRLTQSGRLICDLCHFSCATRINRCRIFRRDRKSLNLSLCQFKLS